MDRRETLARQEIEDHPVSRANQDVADPSVWLANPEIPAWAAIVVHPDAVSEVIAVTMAEWAHWDPKVLRARQAFRADMDYTVIPARIWRVPRARLVSMDCPARMAIAVSAARSVYPVTRVCPARVTTSLVLLAPRDHLDSADVPVTMVATD